MPTTQTDPRAATKGGSLPIRPPTHAELVRKVARVIWEAMPNGTPAPMPFRSLVEEDQREKLAEAEAVLKYLSMHLVFPLWVEAMNKDAQVASKVLERAGEILSGGPLFQLQGGDQQ